MTRQPAPASTTPRWSEAKASLELAVAQCLENGSLSAWPASAMARLWELLSNPVRPLALPAGSRVVGIGGATLGGAGKTPATLELARGLAKAADGWPCRRTGGPVAPVAVVASGYRARVGGARVVRPDDRAEEVGDEALLLARALAEQRLPVVVGARRSAALGLATALGGVVLVDGLLQARPARLACALLVLDAAAPWGAGHCPPAGDLRARRQRLLTAADLVLLCRDPAQPRPFAGLTCGLGLPVYEAASDIVGAYGCNGQLASMRQLRRQRIGLLLAIAHPDRVRRALAARGVVPVRVEFFPDHGAPDRRGGQVSGAPADSGSRVDAWLTTSKCAQKLGDSYRGAPVWVLAHRLALPAPLVEHVCDALSLRAEPW